MVFWEYFCVIGFYLLVLWVFEFIGLILVIVEVVVKIWCGLVIGEMGVFGELLMIGVGWDYLFILVLL